MIVSTRLRTLVESAVGQVGEGVIAFLLVPIFVAWLGDESWGLVALIPLVNGLLAVAGFPLATAVNREISRLALTRESDAAHAGLAADESRRVLRVIEGAFLLVAGAGATLVWIAAPWIVERWLSPVELSQSTCVTALRIIGVYAAILLIRSAHIGALYGLQRVGTANTLTLSTAAATGLAGLLAAGPLRPRDPDDVVIAFLAAQCAVHALGALVIALLAWRSMPRSESPVVGLAAAGGVEDGRAPTPSSVARVRADERAAALAPSLATWRRLWPFVRGAVIVALAGGVLSQLDRLVVSRLLTLDDYGRYSLAAMLATGVALLVRAVNMASFPDLSRAFATGRRAEHTAALHRWTRAAGIVAVPAAVTMAIFPRESLATWLGPGQVDDGMAQILVALAIGWGFNGLAAPAFSAALAAGWTRFAAIQNAIALCVMPLAMVLFVPRLGPLGAALAWTTINLVYVLATIPMLLFPRLIPGGAVTWLARGVLPALLAATVVAAALRMVIPHATDRLESAGVIIVVAIATTIASTAAARLVRYP